MKKIRSKMIVMSSHNIVNQFSDAQGQITPGILLGTGGNLNSIKISCMYSLHARMEMIQSKMNGLEWSQHFSNYKSMGILSDAQGQ